MKMKILFFASISIAKNEDCIVTKKETLCELSWTATDRSIKKLQVFRSNCEFPEGNIRPCIDFRVCAGNKKIESGASKLFKDSDLNMYCETKNPVDLIDSSEVDQPKAFLSCVKNKYAGEVELAVQKETKKCKLNLKKVLK